MKFEYKCEDCETICKKPDELRAHRWEKHLGRKRIYCDVEGCYFKSYLPKAYRRHMRAGKHGENRPRGMNAVTIEAMKTTGAK